MLDRPVAAFDIETVPDADYGRRVLGFEGNDEAVVRRMVAERLEETEGRTEYPQQPLHRVVTICVAWLDPTHGRFKLDALGGPEASEAERLAAFGRLFEPSTAPRLVSWNGNGFDLPVIRYRAMLHRVAIPALYRSDGDWRWNNYGNRFHDMHVDLMDVLTGYGAAPRAGLGLVAETLGLPGKRFLEEPVWEHVLRGELERVREYCKLDVVTTLLVYLRWCVHRGALDAAGERRWLALVRDALAAEAWEGWADIVTSLEASA